ncbi:dTDP-4-amino-4,6-dideoxygalactose transaminase [Paraburkholderia domus]|uniref:dTDP-4-amino-4,6-dideoxygalactose transaminase n=1 Tax=Paraburkholderia domus TaxID=2793075 RepID=UPI0019118A95|nr:dTDP-4-amino-4,6-dideoxygalactose transaminase [Paraburkholderia domus]CAE6811911.1 dTDP-4-amino-4,6-dideoxygalactose transaminase [Paraburkholderia domus]
MSDVSKRDELIPFNKPYLHGRELVYIAEAVASGKISGDGIFSKRCHQYFENRYAIKKALLTTSCTDALEMAALLLKIQEGDEVILPSYTFVSTANAFVLRGARLVFADSYATDPNIDPEQVERLITPRTKAIVVVHYAGVACDMDRILEIANRNGIAVIEDAAQAIDSFYKGRPLGSIGALGAFSFHETKNIISGEGGLLTVNDEQYMARAEIIREKGTNRSAFFRGEVDKYGWVDIGSSFLPSEIVAAYLYAQLEQLDAIQARRLAIHQRYTNQLKDLTERGCFELPHIPVWATNNAHMFYVVCRSLDERTRLVQYLKDRNIVSVFHYLSLHSSTFYADKHDGRILPNSDRYTECLLRLPLYYELSDKQVDRVCDGLEGFFGARG